MSILISPDLFDQSNKQVVSDIKNSSNPQIVTKKDTTPTIYEWKLEIPKITVSAPVIPNVDGASKAAYDEALKGGTAHFKGTSIPGGDGNTVIFGHSSSILGDGKYDKVFARLNELNIGDPIEILFNGIRYGYKISEKKVTSANDTSVLSQTNTEALTLMTCWPVGTDQKRLIVIAKPVK